MGDVDNKDFDNPAVIVGQKRGNTDNGGPASKRANVTDLEGLSLEYSILIVCFSPSKGLNSIGRRWSVDWQR